MDGLGHLVCHRERKVEIRERELTVSPSHNRHPGLPRSLPAPIHLLVMSHPYSQASSSSSLSVPCKWGYCVERFEDAHVLRAHVRAHVRQERSIPTDELDVESRGGKWYAREKQSQGFGESKHL